MLPVRTASCTTRHPTTCRTCSRRSDGDVGVMQRNFPPSGEGRAFMQRATCLPPLRGGTKGGVNPRAKSSPAITCITPSPHPRSLPAGEGGAFVQRAACLPPLRGGRKGGVNPASETRTADHLHQRLSRPAVPPRWGGRPGRRLREVRTSRDARPAGRLTSPARSRPCGDRRRRSGCPSRGRSRSPGRRPAARRGR